MPGTTLGTAYVQIVPSTQGIAGSISSVMGGEATAAGRIESHLLIFMETLLSKTGILYQSTL